MSRITIPTINTIIEIAFEKPTNIEIIIAEIPINNLIILSIFPTFFDSIFSSQKSLLNITIFFVNNCLNSKYDYSSQGRFSLIGIALGIASPKIAGLKVLIRYVATPALFIIGTSAQETFTPCAAKAL